MGASTLLLGLIAAATLVMAIVQVGVIIYGARLARRVNRLVDVVEQEIKPTLERVHEMSGEAARATSLAMRQVERADRLFAQLTGQVDQVLKIAQDALVEPVRQGGAFLLGLRAALLAFSRGGGRAASGGGRAGDETARRSPRAASAGGR